MENLDRLLLAQRAETYLRSLSLETPNRRTGSPGNRAATDFFAREMDRAGFAVEMPGFDCLDWRQAGARLQADGQNFEVNVSPYSLGCRTQAALVVVSTVDELATANAKGRILLLSGEIAKEQLMPKNFPFYNPEGHQQIIALLERRAPAAIVAATTENPEMAGAVYPFPLIEDGDFDIPSVYMTEAEGQRLAAYAGKEVALEIDAQRSPRRGCNVIARKGDPRRRVVVFAHIDAKDGTPGAIDNAAGTVILLLLAELLADYAGEMGVEIVAMNGEDYYASSGEKLYLQLNEGRFDEIILGVNIDGAGFIEGGTAYSLYACPDGLAQWVRQAFAAYPGLVEGEPWYQGDHGLFLMNQRPALAITSERLMELETTVVHTTKDTPEIVDPAKLVEVALALRDLLVQFECNVWRDFPGEPA